MFLLRLRLLLELMVFIIMFTTIVEQVFLLPKLPQIILLTVFFIVGKLLWLLVLPVGNGTLLLGAALGFSELVRLGVVARMPRIIGVQAAACAPLSAAFERGETEPVQVVAKPTEAEGIAIAQPARGAQILAAVRASGGSFLSVEEDDIAASLRDCCRMGWFIEPTAAAVIAGARRYAATAASGETIVTAFTGHGLKAPATVAGMVRQETGQ